MQYLVRGPSISPWMSPASREYAEVFRHGRLSEGELDDDVAGDARLSFVEHAQDLHSCRMRQGLGHESERVVVGSGGDRLQMWGSDALRDGLSGPAPGKWSCLRGHSHRPAGVLAPGSRGQYRLRAHRAT